MGEEKEQLIREAMNSGISAQSIYETLSKMFGSGDLSKYTNRQIKLAIDNICDMKLNSLSVINQNYSSDLVRNNYDKIVDSLRNGISPEEIANKLIKAVKDKNISAADFKYLIGLIANLKKKDLKYIKNDSKTYQKVID